MTVYEMLSGEKPFKGDRAHIIVEHSALPVPPLAAKVPGLSQRLCQAVEKGLAKSAADRFPTCRDFAAAIVAELAVLPPEPDTARLLCPSCKNILKLPQKAAGKIGRCPRCREAVDVATDLCSLWLESEERHDRALAGEKNPRAVSPIDEDVNPISTRAKQRWGLKEWGVALLAACFGFGVGYLPGASRYAALKADLSRLQSENGRLRAVVRADAPAQDIRQLKALAVPDAIRLVKLNEGTLYLDSLTTLSPEVASVLSQYKDGLSLNGIKRLSTEAETAMARHSGGLQLEGLVAVESVALATTLASGVWGSFGYVNLRNVTEISPEVATALRATARGSLTIGLREPSPAVLTALGRGTSHLSLPAVSSLTESAVDALCAAGGNYYLDLPALASISSAVAARLASRRGGMGLGVPTLSDEAAIALATSSDGIWLSMLERVPPAGLAALKNKLGSGLPSQLYTPLERFLWCVTGWPKLLLLASLSMIASLVLVSVYLGWRLQKHRPEMKPTVEQVKAAYGPVILAIAILAGWITFLSLKVLPPRWKLLDDRGQSFGWSEFAGLDWLLCGLSLAICGAVVFCFLAARRTVMVGEYVWGMTSYAHAAGWVGLACGVCGSVLLFFMLRDVAWSTAARLAWTPRNGGLWFGWLCLGLPWMYLLLPIAALLEYVRRISPRASPSFRACVAGLGTVDGGVIPWSRFASYVWKPDHLELTLKREYMGRPIRLRGVVPPEQREVAQSFLAARIPGQGPPTIGRESS
ncbi:MAG: hypothetical protein WCH40_09520 [Verrucomicrobiales bacterium]